MLDALIWESGYFNQDIDYALFNLENDLKKMVALSAGNEITMDDFTDSISDNLEHNTFKMIDAISQSRKQEAFRLLHGLDHSDVFFVFIENVTYLVKELSSFFR